MSRAVASTSRQQERAFLRLVSDSPSDRPARVVAEQIAEAKIESLCVFVVTASFDEPVRARRGDLVFIYSLPRNVWLFDKNADIVLDRGAVSNRELWPLLHRLRDAGYIAPLDTTEAMRFARPPRPVLVQSSSFVQARSAAGVAR